MMDSLEAARRIEDHLRAHHMKEQPRCEKITEALTLAVKVLTQHSMVKEEFPNNTVITIPQNLSFEYLTRANLAELKAQIEAIMEGVSF